MTTILLKKKPQVFIAMQWTGDNRGEIEDFCSGYAITGDRGEDIDLRSLFLKHPAIEEPSVLRLNGYVLKDPVRGFVKAIMDHELYLYEEVES